MMGEGMMYMPEYLSASSHMQHWTKKLKLWPQRSIASCL